MRRQHWQRVVAGLDAEHDAVEIYRILSFHEFPWDIEQSLSLALFRTFAVPSIGSLLARTGEFTERTQKRYDDTAIVLEEILHRGPQTGDGLEALRRMNQMHSAYPISQGDLRYVLSTFVVVPTRWVDQHGYRRLTGHERDAVVAYFARLGRLMNIADLPTDYAGYERLLDEYEREHFAPDDGGRRVADATLGLMASWYPRPLRSLVRAGSIALLDDRLRTALGYRTPARPLVVAVHATLALRARLLRLAPARRTARLPSQGSHVRSYPGGYDVRTLGTFPRQASGRGPGPSLGELRH